MGETGVPIEKHRPVTDKFDHIMLYRVLLAISRILSVFNIYLYTLVKFIVVYMYINPIGGVFVSVLSSNAMDRSGKTNVVFNSRICFLLR